MLDLAKRTPGAAMRRRPAATGKAEHWADDLLSLIADLSRHYSFQAPLSDPLSLILRENIGYLIDDARRQALFDEFRARIGIHAEKIAHAPHALLLDIAKRGGMRPETRVERWRRIAEIVLDACGGDLSAALRAMPASKAADPPQAISLHRRSWRRPDSLVLRHRRATLARLQRVAHPGAPRICRSRGILRRDLHGCDCLLRSHGSSQSGLADLRAHAPPRARSKSLQARYSSVPGVSAGESLRPCAGSRALAPPQGDFDLAALQRGSIFASSPQHATQHAPRA